MLTGDATIVNPGEVCDELLQEFHRVDEGIGIEGKWAGGSVTAVCRGWGSTKVRYSSFEVQLIQSVTNPSLLFISFQSSSLLSPSIISHQRI